MTQDQLEQALRELFLQDIEDTGFDLNQVPRGTQRYAGFRDWGASQWQ